MVKGALSSSRNKQTLREEVEGKDEEEDEEEVVVSDIGRSDSGK